jgi:hypothetical protein
LNGFIGGQMRRVSPPIKTPDVLVRSFPDLSRQAHDPRLFLGFLRISGFLHLI